MQFVQNLRLTLCSILLFSLIFEGCTNNKMPAMMTSASKKSYLALGDSYTIGQSVNYTDKFPVQLADRLAAKQIQINIPDIIAVTGWTTSNLLEAVNIKKPATTYNLVTLLIGVNNQYQGRSIEEYRIEFQQLLDLSIKYAGGKKQNVIVVSIPDYSVTPFAANSDKAKIAREIDLFNTANKSITLTAGVQYVDITAISRSNNPALVAPDGLHPSGAQYSLWVDKILPVAANILQ